MTHVFIVPLTLNSIPILTCVWGLIINTIMLACVSNWRHSTKTKHYINLHFLVQPIAMEDNPKKLFSKQIIMSQKPTQQQNTIFQIDSPPSYEWKLLIDDEVAAAELRTVDGFFSGGSETLALSCAPTLISGLRRNLSGHRLGFICPISFICSLLNFLLVNHAPPRQPKPYLCMMGESLIPKSYCSSV